VKQGQRAPEKVFEGDEGMGIYEWYWSKRLGKEG